MPRKKRPATPQEKRIVRRRFRRRELSNYWVNITRPLPRNQLRTLIFSQGRSGSTLLESLICSTGYFEQTGEILGPFHKTKYHQGEAFFPVHFVHGIVKRSPRKNFIFHLKISHLTEERKRPLDSNKVLKRFQKYGWRIIFLSRENRIKHALSNLVMRQRGEAHKYSEPKEKFQITVDCDDFIKRVNHRIYLDTLEQDAVQGINFHRITYEQNLEHSEQHQATVNSIFNDLGLEPREVSTRHRKINRQSMEDLIVNYGEFRDRMTQQGWEHFLD